MAEHDHALVPHPEADSWYQCACGHGMFDFEMPLPDVADFAEKVAEVPLMDWQREFLNSARVGWRDPIRPTRRGKQAAYEETVREMSQTYGPGEPLLDRQGRVRGHQWFKDATDSLGGMDEASVLRLGQP